MPLLPPVTRATLPVRSNGLLSSMRRTVGVRARRRRTRRDSVTPACTWSVFVSPPICATSPTRNSTNSPARSATSSSPRCPTTPATSARTSARSSSRSPSTGCSTRRPTRSSGTPATRPTSTRSSPGRQAGFQQLRQAGGLSGYPSREESVHDYVENSHASTALSYAYGMAVARDLGTDPHRHIVAVIGDGSLTGGMAYEALNNIGHGGRRVIMVLNDNGRSYAPTVSNLSANSQGRDERSTHPSLPDRVTDKLATAFTDIRLNPVYVRRQRRLEEFLQSLPVVGHQAGSAMDAFKAGVREFLQPPSFFEALGVRYVGPFDGHDIEQMEHALHNAVELSEDGPILVHVLTQKGRGLPAGRGRRREAPPRRAGVRSARRAAQGRVDGLHPGVRRGDHQGGRGRPTARGDHRGDARTDGPPAVPGPLPRTVLRRRHRRTARRHRRGRHGDGRAPPGGGHLLDVPQPGVGPGRVRRGAAPAAGDLLPRPRRHHGPRRPEPPRRLRHGAALPGAGDAGARPVERAGTRPDDARRDDPRRCRPGGHPLPTWRGAQRHRARGRHGDRRPQGPRSAAADRVHHRRRQDARSCREGGGPVGAPTASRSRCGTRAAWRRSTP